MMSVADRLSPFRRVQQTSKRFLSLASLYGERSSVGSTQSSLSPTSMPFRIMALMTGVKAGVKAGIRV